MSQRRNQKPAAPNRNERVGVAFFLGNIENILIAIDGRSRLAHFCLVFILWSFSQRKQHFPVFK